MEYVSKSVLIIWIWFIKINSTCIMRSWIYRDRKGKKTNRK